MMRMKFRSVFILLASLVMVHTSPVVSYSGHSSPNSLLIGKDPHYNSDVFLYTDSIINFDANITTATFCVDIDHITEEYTADYNCLDRTINIFSVAVKDKDRTIEEKRLYIYEPVAKNTMDAKLLNAVCGYRDKYSQSSSHPLN